MPNFFRTCLVVFALSLSSISWAQETLEPVRPSKVGQFLREYCLDCHEGDDGEGGFDLLKLSDELADPRMMDRWVRILDRVHDGEMPPPEDIEVDEEESISFLNSTREWLVDAQRQLQAERGRVQSRRLTNEQLERTLHDLLAIDVPLASLMPEEQRTDAFANIADAQSMSHFHLETHLTVVDAALDAAFERASDESETWDRQYTARDLARRNPRQRCRDPEMLDGKAVVWNGGVTYYGRITSTTMRESGWYRVTFDASALNQPDDRGVWCSVRSGRCTSGAPLLTWIGSFEANTDPTQQTFDAWIPAGHMLEIRPADATLKKARFRGGQVGAGEGGPQNVPGLALHSMSIERIHPGGDVELVRQHLFGDLEVKRLKRGKVAIAGNPSEAAVLDQVRAFANRAFRRPVSDELLHPYLQLAQQSLEQGYDPVDALRRSYRAILCSPRFLYLVEPRAQSLPTWTAGKPSWPLDDHAVASRLSYLLWGSMPDEELFRLAEEDALQDPEILVAQVERMLSEDRGQEFLKDFAAQWLDLIDIDFTEPDRRLHGDFDVVVQNSMLAETHQFLASLLDANANISTLVNADYTFLNSRLATYYGIEGIEGDQLQRVSLPADSNRGGLLAQGAILKVTANGTNTSPVLRGIWVSERILGVPIPPPPESVPAVEPDIRGAKTIRDQLQKHLADQSCAVCHRKIDPPGFALENFDAAGRWREKYPGFRSKKDKTVGNIDPSYVLADGRAFESFTKFRSLVAEDPKPIAKNFVEKLMVFGTGAPINIADRQVIDTIVEEAADHDYGMRSLLHAVVTSPTFLSK